MSVPRIQSFADFWPYYISEHRDPRCRWVHFVGTTGFLTILMASITATPVRMGVALALCSGAIAAGMALESRRSAAPILLGVIGAMALANPWVLAGVGVAYSGAWFGHFVIEKNRPATFVYPLWSLAGDFRMYFWMLRGRLWSGNGSEVAPLS